MRLLPKLTLGVLAASALPLAFLGAISVGLGEKSLRARAEQDHRDLGATAAAGVERFLGGVVADLASYPTEIAGLADRPDDVLVGAARLAYRSSPDLTVVAVLDTSGNERVPSVRARDGEEAAALGGRAVVSDAEVEQFLRRVPLRAALAKGAAVGEPAAAGGETRVAVAVAFPPAAPRLLLCADVSFARLDAELRRLPGLSAVENEVVVIDGRRRALAGGAAARRPLDAVAVPGDRDPAGPLPAAAVVATLAPGGEDARLAAFAPVAGGEFGVVVSQPERRAFAAVRDLKARLAYWVAVSVVAAIVVGFLLARDVARRIGALADGTVALAAGRFEARLDATTPDEIGDLGRSFNRMAADLGRAAEEIRRRAEEIREKNEEISGWNAELERRVAEKSAELEKAQDLLLRSRSLSAVGTLGAGVAHEINNPLTGVLGGAQLLLMEVEEGTRLHGMVRDIETQAQRIRGIVQEVLEATREALPEERIALDLNAIARRAVERAGAEELKRSRIEVAFDLADGLPQVRGNPMELADVVAELISNARRAMPAGGRVVVKSAADRGRVLLAVSDSGDGIPPEHVEKIFDPFFTTKKEWTAVGMGLTRVHRVVESHGGTITVDSRLGAGATFTMSFPRDPGRAHIS